MSIERIIGSRTVFGLGADIICGFPGETDDDHWQTVALVERLPFTSLHVFPYSARPGAVASRLGGTVGSIEVDRRCSELREISRRKAAHYTELRAGQQADVVAISTHEGLTEDYITVGISAPFIRRRDRFDATLTLRGGRLTAVTADTLEA
jgi:threonylcarbamoyladenosine tRNA methylthiotransferase MtaB